jgi:hypothetical protein
MILIEEFVRTERGEYTLPVEYKCHVFQDRIGAIQVIERDHARPATSKHTFYMPNWNPFKEKMLDNYPLGNYMDPPACLDEILKAAKSLGTAYGTYVRIDFYATDKGCVFGEFSSTPGEGRDFTEYADRYFESLWREVIPEKM